MNIKDSKLIAGRKEKLEGRLARNAPFKSPCYNLDYEVSDRVRGTSHGGVAALLELARGSGLAENIDADVVVLDQHRPYKESDHIFALVASVLAGGTCPEDMRRLRKDGEFLDSIGMDRFPDSTTSGDFLRRFTTTEIGALQDAILETSEQVLRAKLSPGERVVGHIDADGSMVETGAETMAGIDYNGHKRAWGYHPLLISLANTAQPLMLVNRPGNVASHQDAARALDVVAKSILEVFDRVMLRGDTDFSQTKHLDGWHEDGRIDFVFGYDACPKLRGIAEALPGGVWRELSRPILIDQAAPVPGKPRAKPERIKDAIVKERGFKTLKLVREHIAEFEYQPVACKRVYRMVCVRKEIEVTQGQLELENEIRYYFYITNLVGGPSEEIVLNANRRCNQENLIAQLKGQVHALSCTSNTLEANWAWMVITSLAWTLKSWFALFAPVTERARLVGMEFRTFQNYFMNVPAQFVRRARRSVLRLIGGTAAALELFLNTWADIRKLRRLRT